MMKFQKIKNISLSYFQKQLNSSQQGYWLISSFYNDTYQYDNIFVVFWHLFLKSEKFIFF